MYPTLTSLSENEKEILKELRESVSDILKSHHDDLYLVKWLKGFCYAPKYYIITYDETSVELCLLIACRFDKEKAEESIRKSFNGFRKEYNMETIKNDFTVPEALQKFGFDGFLGFDKEGAPVRLVLANKSDIKGLQNSVTEEDIIKYIFYLLELDNEMRLENNEKNGLWAEKNVYIVEMDVFPLSEIFSKTLLDLAIKVTRMYTSNFPENLKTLAFINDISYYHLVNSCLSNIISYLEEVRRNMEDEPKEHSHIDVLSSVEDVMKERKAPAFTHWVYGIVKQMLPSDMAPKIRIFGADGWKEQLLDFCGPDVLPAYMGGKLTDPDGNPRCLTMEEELSRSRVVPQGGEVPKEYYLQYKKRLQPGNPDVHSAVIDIKSSLVVEIPVDDSNAVLFWEFQTEKYDIGCGLSYKKDAQTDDKELQILLPIRRSKCEEVASDGMFACEKPGIYVLHFDNTYSWVNQKKLMYKVEVLLPNDIVKTYELEDEIQ